MALDHGPPQEDSALGFVARREGGRVTSSDPTALRRRLGRLGRKPKAEPKARPRASGGLPEGEEVDTSAGIAYRIESSFPSDHLHGGSRLSDLFDFDAALAAEVGRDPALGDLAPRDLLFLDTETTGLAGGAGTLVFLVGVGRFEGDRFRLRQYFLRDPAEEAGMLHALQEDLEAGRGFVTFNGRAFDVPLLEMRYVVGLRQRPALTSWPHLDLLPPSRRLWRRVLPNCRLGTLERGLLAIERAEADVPGAEIPGMYLDYLRTGDGAEMSRVVYHNAVDVLTLVGLTVEVLRRHGQRDPGGLSAPEALAVGRWHQRAGRRGDAELAFQAAVTGGSEEVQREALRRYTTMLKRQGRIEEAVRGWEAWHALAPDDPRPCVELAMAFEWRTKDLGAAQAWTQAGMVCLSHWPAGWRRNEAWRALEHRMARLARKLSAVA